MNQDAVEYRVSYLGKKGKKKKISEKLEKNFFRIKFAA